MRSAKLTRTSCALLALTLTAGFASAQRTWVVDGDNRAGTDFSSLPAAAAAVGDGDTVLVRARAGGLEYRDGGTWTKGVTVLCEPGTKILAAQVSGQALQVRNLPAGLTFAWKGGEPGRSAPVLDVQIAATRGRVILDRIECSRLLIQSAAAVFVNDSGVAQGVDASSASTLFLTGCRIVGPSGAGAAPGLLVSLCWVALAQCTVTGGSYQTSSSSGSSQPGIFFSNPFVSLKYGTVRLCGDTGSVIKPGEPAPLQAKAPSVLVNNALLERDAKVQLPGGVLFAGTGSQVVHPLTALAAVAVPTPQGENVVANVVAATGTGVAVFFGLPGDGLYVGIEDTGLWIDPGTLTLLGSGPNHAVPVPNDPSLRGLKLALQALSGGTTWSLSNPVLVVLD